MNTDTRPHPKYNTGHAHPASLAYGRQPIDLTRRNRKVHLIWNDRAQCSICEGRQEPYQKNYRSRMVYFHDGQAEFLYCIPCAAVTFGMSQQNLIASLNLESVFQDQECAERAQRRADRMAKFQLQTA